MEDDIAERVHLVRLAVTGLEGDDSDPIERELYRIIEDIRSISDEVHPPLTAKAIAKIRREAGVEA
jgi:hypothetical protein